MSGLLLTRDESRIRLAVSKGYSIDVDGNVFSPRKKLKLMSCKKGGYLYFNVRVKHMMKIYVHRFQAYQKFGDQMFKKGLFVRHLNGNAQDNSRENMGLGTHSQNQMDKSPEVRKRMATHAYRVANPRSEQERFKIYELLAEGLSYNEIGKRTGVSKSTLSYMKNHSEEYGSFLRGEGVV